MQLLKGIREKAKEKCAHVGLGAMHNLFFVNQSKQIAERKGYAKVTIFRKPNDLVSALKNSEIDSAVRGTLDAKSVINELKVQFKLKYISRVAFLITSYGKEFLLAPVGIDEGENIDQKLELMILGSKYLSSFGIQPKIGIISGGRIEDFGRYKYVDKTISEGEKLAELAKKNKLSAKHYGILVENAIKECNFIIAPDGISGNLMFRTLHFLGSGSAIGAPIVNIKKVFIDTSRAKNEYTDAIAFASALTADKQDKILRLVKQS